MKLRNNNSSLYTWFLKIILISLLYEIGEVKVVY